MATHGQQKVAVASHGKIALRIILHDRGRGKIKEVVVCHEATIWLQGDWIAVGDRSTILPDSVRLMSRDEDGKVFLYPRHAAMAGWTIRLEGAADNERVLLQPGASCEVDRGEVQLNCWVVRLLKEPPALVPTPATAPSPHGQDHTKIEPDELALHPLARWIFRSLLRLLDRNP